MRTRPPPRRQRGRLRNRLREARQRLRDILEDLLRDYLVPGQDIDAELRFILSK